MAVARTKREADERVTADLAEQETDRASARRFFRWWLGGATVLTLIGNAADALIGASASAPVRIIVHLVPPLIALVAIHAVTVLARVGRVHRASALRLRDAGGTTVFAVLIAGALALSAAVLSYAGLRSVAESAGMGGWLAVLWPLTIDAGIAVSSVALVVLRPASSADLRTARTALAETAQVRTAQPATSQKVAVHSPGTRSGALQKAPGDAPRTAPRAPSVSAGGGVHGAPQAPTGAPTTEHTNSHGAPSPEYADRAQRIVDMGAVTIAVEQVAAVLAAVAAGASATRAAADVGVNRRTVAKILHANAELETETRVLTAV